MYSGTDKCVRPVQQKAAKFTKHTKDFDCETLVQRRTVARLCVLFKACCGERAWKAILDRHSVSYNTTYFAIEPLSVVVPEWLCG